MNSQFSALSCFCGGEIVAQVTEATRASASKVEQGGCKKLCYSTNVRKYCTQHSLLSVLVKNGKPGSNKALRSALQEIQGPEEQVKNTMGIQSAKSRIWGCYRACLCFPATLSDSHPGPPAPFPSTRAGAPTPLPSSSFPTALAHSLLSHLLSASLCLLHTTRCCATFLPRPKAMNVYGGAATALCELGVLRN